MDDMPLIHTTKGNLPVDALTWSDGWEFQANGVTYWSEYRLDGEVVRRDVARYQLPEGRSLGVVQGDIV